MSVSLPGTINRENTDLKGRLWQALQGLKLLGWLWGLKAVGEE